MKTTVLAITRLPERYRNDLVQFGDVSKDIVRSLVDFLAESEESQTGIASSRRIRELAQETNLSGDKLYRLLGVLRYSRILLSHFRENPGDLVDDLLNEEVITENAAENLRIALELLQQRQPLRPTPADSFTQILPVYHSSTARCIVLPAYDKDNISDDLPDDYSSEVSALLYGVALHLHFHGPIEQENLSLYLAEGDIDRLLKQLEFAKEQLSVLKRQLKLGG